MDSAAIRWSPQQGASWWWQAAGAARWREVLSIRLRVPGMRGDVPEPLARQLEFNVRALLEAAGYEDMGDEGLMVAVAPMGDPAEQVVAVAYASSTRSPGRALDDA
ncbi:MAG: hypothetical protein QOK40_1045 [Miltoncostaeaceae bacterium]|jgi:hypothetical protein|nr:hypothetical protein [Miltoncostaeaceae bacterium]